MENFTIIMNPKQRKRYINKYIKNNGLPKIEENPNSAYCPLALTNTPKELKEIARSRQEILINKVLIPAGITPYDPGTAKYSPNTNTTSEPPEVYRADVAKIVEARFFTGHRFIPSDGFGAESQIAKEINRMAVILFDKNLRVTRMQPSGAICLQYENFNNEVGNFIPVFKMLQDFEPGAGLNREGIPILLGFPRRGGTVVNLEEEVYKEFPHLKYTYDGNAPVTDLMPRNPKQFYENRT